VQRLYASVPALEGTKPDFVITSEIASKLGLALQSTQVEDAFTALAAAVPQFNSLTYASLAAADGQWPPSGGKDGYFGGTGNKNTQGVGVTLALQGNEPGQSAEFAFPAALSPAQGECLVVPTTALYNQGLQMKASTLLDGRTPKAAFVLHPADAEGLNLNEGGSLILQTMDRSFSAVTEFSEAVPRGTILVRREMGIPILLPTLVRPVVGDHEPKLES
jgi:predicted molibdopterin-dependent oxidoreductase YjgC